MVRKPDIKEEEFLAWDQFDRKAPAVALPAIYGHAEGLSGKCRTWYWTSIGRKRIVSTGVRLVALLLGAFGVVAPIVAAIWSEEHIRLLWSQLAVVALALAGLTQVADRVFGWSSGWMRYISTVTAMENLTRQFQLDWAAYFVNQGQAVPGDVRPLFDIAQRFEVQLAELQTRETDNWVIEFNTGLTALSEIIKTARESAERSAADGRASVQASIKASASGALELTFTTAAQPPPVVAVTLDGGEAETCKSLSWGRLEIDPGAHRLVVHTLHEGVIVSEVVKIVDVSAGGTTRLVLAL
jgi:hypothetical protein